MTRLAIAAAAAVLLPLGASAGEKPHAEYVASVSTYKPIQGFTHTVGSRHFVGYFVTAKDGCAVTVIDATVGDERLADTPRRQKINLVAGGRTEVKADHGKALGIGCGADADRIHVAVLEARGVDSASR